jgi:hypothetical protein
VATKGMASGLSSSLLSIVTTAAAKNSFNRPPDGRHFQVWTGSCQSGTLPGMKVCRPLLAAAALAVVALVAGLLLAPRKPPQAPPLPNPNGYDDFLAAAKLSAPTLGDYRTMEARDLRVLVLVNAEALRKLREGLNRECRVPAVDAGNAFPDRSSQLQQFRNLTRNLTFALAAEGRLAEMESRTNDAARSYLDLVRFGHEFARGGLVVDTSLGIASEGVGLPSLQGLVRNLPAGECRQLAQALEAIDVRAEPLTEVLLREEAVVRRVVSLPRRMLGVLRSRQATESREKLAKVFQSRQKQRRQLLVTLAARAYELEHGRPPKTAADLVPAYLKAIPQDPVTGTNITLP